MSEEELDGRDSEGVEERHVLEPPGYMYDLAAVVVFESRCKPQGAGSEAHGARRSAQRAPRRLPAQDVLTSVGATDCNAILHQRGL
jgi:hypothetical protein